MSSLAFFCCCCCFLISVILEVLIKWQNQCGISNLPKLHGKTGALSLRRDLAVFVLQEGFILPVTYEEVSSSKLTDNQKADRLLSCTRDEIKMSSKKYHTNMCLAIGIEYLYTYRMGMWGT